MITDGVTEGKAFSGYWSAGKSCGFGFVWGRGRYALREG
jgi:hypothetical protein